MHPRVLERGLDVVDVVLGLEDLGVPPEEPAEQILAVTAGPDPDLAKAASNAALSRRPRSRNGWLDRVVHEVDLELRHLPDAVAPHARQAQELALPDPCLDEGRDEPHQGLVLLPYVLVGRGPRQSERDVDAFEGHERDADLVGQLGERLGPSVAVAVPRSRRSRATDRPRRPPPRRPSRRSRAGRGRGRTVHGARRDGRRSRRSVRGCPARRRTRSAPGSSRPARRPQPR